MPTKNQSHRKLSSPPKSADVIVQLPSELLEPLGKLLNEVALSKQREREDKEKKPKSRWISFWTWWKDYGASAATIVTIISALIGGLWTLNQYIVQEREKIAQQERQANLERQSLIAQFASDLSDPGKRNASAYAFAILAGEDAVPLLASELVSSVKYDNDHSYQDALIRSLIQVGEPALIPVLDINRRASIEGGEANDQIVKATQPIIYYYLTSKPEFFIEKKEVLLNVRIRDQRLDASNFEKINFSGAVFYNTTMCRARFVEGRFHNVNIVTSELGGANFDRAEIYGMQIDKTTKAVGINFVGATIVFSNFPNTNMPSSNWREAKIADSYLDFANLQGANFSNTKITNTTLFDANLFEARFENTIFDNVLFDGADLENTNFTGASFERIVIAPFGELGDTPRVMLSTVSGNYDEGSAFVRGANFQDVTGLDQESLEYLCKWGAVNVPGGCDGIEVEDMSIVNKTRSKTYDWCY